jgi:NADP-dependent 3-hydroxy acid dehydrogenase YdfG
MSPAWTSYPRTIGQEHLKFNSAARNRERMDDLAKKPAADTRRKVEILAGDLTNSNDLSGLERILRGDSRVTLLVNNADVGTTAPLLNSDVADMNRRITLIGRLIEVVKRAALRTQLTAVVRSMTRLSVHEALLEQTSRLVCEYARIAI